MDSAVWPIDLVFGLLAANLKTNKCLLIIAGTWVDKSCYRREVYDSNKTQVSQNVLFRVTTCKAALTSTEALIFPRENVS